MAGDSSFLGPLSPRLQDKDAREFALERLKEFIQCVVFRRTLDAGQEPEAFRLSEKRIHIYQPDDIVTLAPPSIGIVPSRGTHESFGLGPPSICEDSKDVYGQGTVLVIQSEYKELIGVEVWGDKHALRRGMIAGLKQVLRISEQSYALRLSLPAYFDRTVTFALNDSEYIEEPDTARNRRRGHLFLEMTVPEVLLVDYVLLKPYVDLRVTDGNLELELDC